MASSIAPCQVDFQMHVIDIDMDDIEDINTFLAADKHMYAQYIWYPTCLAFANHLIIKTMENTLSSSPGFTSNGWHATKFKGPDFTNYQYLRLLVNFLSKSNSDTFTQVHFIPWIFQMKPPPAWGCPTHHIF